MNGHGDIDVEDLVVPVADKPVKVAAVRKAKVVTKAEAKDIITSVKSKREPKAAIAAVEDIFEEQQQEDDFGAVEKRQRQVVVEEDEVYNTNSVVTEGAVGTEEFASLQVSENTKRAIVDIMKYK